MVPIIDYDDKEELIVDDNQLDDYDLDQRGSQADITKDTAVKSKVSYIFTHLMVEIIYISQPVPITKMSINFMNGQHQLAHFYKGKNTPALDVLQVINIIN